MSDHLTGLPNELLDVIFSHLSLNDYTTVYSVCRHLKLQAERSMSTCKHGHLDIAALDDRRLAVKGEWCDWSKLETLSITSDPNDESSLAVATNQFQGTDPENLMVHCHFTESSAGLGPTRYINPERVFGSLACKTLMISGLSGEKFRLSNFGRLGVVPSPKTVIQILHQETSRECLSGFYIYRNGPKLGMILVVPPNLPEGETHTIGYDMCGSIRESLTNIRYARSSQQVTLACEEPWSEHECAVVQKFITSEWNWASDAPLTVTPLKYGEQSTLGDALRLYHRSMLRSGRV